MPYRTKIGHLYIPMKKGDGELSPNKAKQLRMFEGDCSGYIDPEEWNTPPVLSDFSQCETQWIEIDKTPEMLQFAKKSSQPIGNPINAHTDKSYRRSTHYISVEALAPYIKEKDWKQNVRIHKHPTPVICLKKIPTEVIKNYKDVDPVKKKLIPDVGQILAGSYTIGPAAGDNYPTFGGAGGFAAALGVNQNGNLLGTNTGAITETGQAQFQNNLNGYEFLITSNIAPQGNPNRGHLIQINYNSWWMLLEHEGPQDISHFEKLNIRRILAAAAVDRCIFGVTANNSAPYININDNIIDVNNLTGGGISLNDITPILYVYNNDIINASIAAAEGYRQTVGRVENIIANNNIYNCTTGIDAAGLNGTFRNNAVMGNTADFANIGAATGRNNFCSDATGANANWAIGTRNQINQAIASAWREINIAQDDFLDILRGGILASTGAPNTIARTSCLRGRPVPNYRGQTSVGAAEIPWQVINQSKMSMGISISM